MSPNAANVAIPALMACSAALWAAAPLAARGAQQGPEAESSASARAPEPSASASPWARGAEIGRKIERAGERAQAALGALELSAREAPAAPEAPDSRRVDLAIARRSGGLGLAFSAPAASRAPAQGPGARWISGPSPVPGLDSADAFRLGALWSRELAGRRVTASAWREAWPAATPSELASAPSAQQASADPVWGSFGARVEVDLSSKFAAASSSRLSFERGLLGFQLEGGAKIGIKKSGGRPTIYYRAQF